MQTQTWVCCCLELEDASAKVVARNSGAAPPRLMPVGVSAAGGVYPPMLQTTNPLGKWTMEIPVLRCAQEGQLDTSRFREMIPLADCSSAKRHCQIPTRRH